MPLPQSWDDDDHDHDLEVVVHPDVADDDHRHHHQVDDVDGLFTTAGYVRHGDTLDDDEDDETKKHVLFIRDKSQSI